jgi:hypothetical protein
MTVIRPSAVGGKFQSGSGFFFEQPSAAATLAGDRLSASESLFEAGALGQVSDAAGVDADGITRMYPPTELAPIGLRFSDHRNGDRYNANHKFVNYEVTGYYQTKNARMIEMKTDGPNHSGCDEMPRCQWAEPRITLSNGAAAISSEWPHPENRPNAPAPSALTLGRSLENKWIGYKVIAYSDANGNRVYEQWLDPDGLNAANGPSNNWILMLKETNTGQIMPNPLRALPLGGRGLEAEIRMPSGHHTSMKWGKVQEIVPPTL